MAREELISSSEMQAKTSLPALFASFPSMSALTAVFIMADEDENSRLCFTPSYATRPTKTAATAHKSTATGFFELFSSVYLRSENLKIPITYIFYIVFPQTSRT